MTFTTIIELLRLMRIVFQIKNGALSTSHPAVPRHSGDFVISCASLPLECTRLFGINL